MQYLTPEVIHDWITALGSGHYSQGQRKLRTVDDTYCCLGVLCDVLDTRHNIGQWHFDNTSRVMAFEFPLPILDHHQRIKQYPHATHQRFIRSSVGLEGPIAKEFNILFGQPHVRSPLLHAIQHTPWSTTILSKPILFSPIEHASRIHIHIQELFAVLNDAVIPLPFSQLAALLTTLPM
jgi:hypothetical protein